jgi:hypothetical protein
MIRQGFEKRALKLRGMSIPNRSYRIQASLLITLHVLICFSAAVSMVTSGSFLMAPLTSILYNVFNCHGRRCFQIAASGDDESGEEDMDVEAPAYGNRSLSWTRRYRKLLPYEFARKSVIRLGLRSRDEWEEFLADGKKALGPYVPNRPDEMYADDWVSWEEFLGVIRPYEEVKNIVQNVLKIRSMDEYKAFVKSNTERAEGLRIPAVPDKFYRDEWVSAEHFFGTWY